MCGICGIVQVTGDPRHVEPDALAAMTEAMVHRGPNDSGMLDAPGVGFGARRLSIVDVEGGHQPFTNEDSTVWGMQNGELYNHLELREQLARDGHRFVSRCDTEVLPHLYEHLGNQFPAALRGKFAAAVWDSRRRRAVVTRDRLGVKPLYYARAGAFLLFASELRSLLASGLVNDDLDVEAVDVYLHLGYFPAPRTPLRAVSKLPPGHSLIVEDGDVRVETYWRYPEPAVADRRLSVEEYGHGLMERLDESVRLRLMSDVPLGAMLSGGLDSSIIVALMARAQRGPVKTFSIGFAEDGRSNELRDARRVARHFGTEHHELELSLADEQVAIEDLAWSLDEPVAELSALGLLALSELAARHVTVALSGQGADELLGGYTKHRAAALTSTWRRLPGDLQRVGGAVASRGRWGSTRAARTLTAEDPVARQLAMSGLLDAGLRSRLFRGALASVPAGTTSGAIRDLLGTVPDEPLSATLYLDAQMALVDNMLHYFDRTSMAHSLEVRVPFLDHHVVEYAARIPSDLKVRRLTTKHVLKRAARGLVPDWVIDKRKIGFFRGSARAWLTAQLDAAIPAYLLAEDARIRELLDADRVAELVALHRSGGGNPQLLLAILMLEVWLSTTLPRAMRAAPRRAPVAA